MRAEGLTSDVTGDEEKVRPDGAQGGAEQREVSGTLRVVGADVEVADLHHPRHVPVHGEDRPRHGRVVVVGRPPRGAQRR